MSDPQNPSGVPAPQQPPYGQAPQHPQAPHHQAPQYPQPAAAQQPQAQATPQQPPYGQAPQYGQAAQHPQAPQYPQRPAAPQQPPYAQAAPYGQAPASDNPLGRTAFLIAVILGAVSALSLLITPILYSTGDYGVADMLSTVVRVLVLLGSVVALVIGIIALRRPEPRLLAAIAVGIAGSLVLSRLVNLLSSLVWTFS